MHKKSTTLMKIHQSILILSLASLTLLYTACNDAWDNHYDKQMLVTDSNVEMYQGDLEKFLASSPEYSTQHALFVQAGIYDKMLPGQEYTILLYPDNILDTTGYAQDSSYAAYCVSDIALAPADMKEGMGIHTWYGKNLWIR